MTETWVEALKFASSAAPSRCFYQHMSSLWNKHVRFARRGHFHQRQKTTTTACTKISTSDSNSVPFPPSLARTTPPPPHTQEKSEIRSRRTFCLVFCFFFFRACATAVCCTLYVCMWYQKESGRFFLTFETTGWISAIS